MKERFSSAKSQLARLIDRSPSNAFDKQVTITSDRKVWNNDSHGSAIQPTHSSHGTIKSVPQTSSGSKMNCSDANSFDSGIQGKIEKMMARTKNIEQKLMTQLQTSPRNKVLASNGKLNTQKSMKCFQRIDKFKQQYQNQPSVKDFIEDKKEFEILDRLWGEVLNKSFDRKVLEQDVNSFIRYVIQWKQNSKNYEILCEDIFLNFGVNQSPECSIPQILESFLTEKNCMHQQLNTVNSQIQKLTHQIQNLQEDRIFYSNEINQRDLKINAMDSEVERLKLNNNCLTEIIYKLQQTKIENDSRVGRGVYDHLQQQNNNLKNTLAQIVEENKHLTKALTEEINFVREAVLDQMRNKMLIYADLIKAEQTIEQLRNMTVMDVNKLKNTINKQFSLKYHDAGETYVPEHYDHSSTEPSQDVQNDLLHSRLTQSNEHILHLQGLLDESRRVNEDILTQRQRLQTLGRKQEYQKQKIKKQLMDIKKVLCEQQCSQCQDIDSELMSVHQKALQVVYKLKNLKQRSSVMETEYNKRQAELSKLVVEYEMLSKRYMSMRLSKNPGGNQQKLIELENINSELDKQIIKLKQTLTEQQKIINLNQRQIQSKNDELIFKNNQIQGMIQNIDGLILENKKLQEQKENNRNDIVNPQRTQIMSQQQELNDLRLELEANLSDCKYDIENMKSKISNERVKRMKSFSICSNEDLIIEDRNPSNLINKSIEQKSQISDCWNNTSGIHQLAARIDSLGVMGFRLDELFEKHHIRGEIAQILNPFLKKLDKIQNIEELLVNIEELLINLKEISQIHHEQDNAFLKFNMGKMQEIFAETKLFMEKQKIDQYLVSEQIDSEAQDLQELTLQSILKI